MRIPKRERAKEAHNTYIRRRYTDDLKQPQANQRTKGNPVKQARSKGFGRGKLLPRHRDTSIEKRDRAQPKKVHSGATGEIWNARV